MTRNRPVPHISEPDQAYIRSLLVHEDAAILAFNKPSGLASQTRGNRARSLDHLLWAFARSNGKRPRLVHRLDAATSGIILAARTQPVAASLSAAFAGRAVTKTYLALVAGALPDMPSGKIDAPILRTEREGCDEIGVDATRGKPALTGWRVLARAGDCALMELAPQTGRMHQLRVHMACLGCPILGDLRYGGRPASRLMLHASSICLEHPGAGPFTARAPASPDFIEHATSVGLVEGVEAFY